MKKIEDYTTEELVALYKRLSVYTTTWWFKYYKTYDKHYKAYTQKTGLEDEPVIIWELDSTRILNPHMKLTKIAEDFCFYHEIRRGNVDAKLDELESGVQDDKTIREVKKLQYEQEALRIIDRCLFWFTGLWEEYIDKYNSSSNRGYLRSPEEIEEELHINDEDNIRHGLATDYQVYEFVWETLQYLSIAQLNKLLKFADEGIKNKWERIAETRGRKSKECEIRQVDIETGDVVNTFTTRNELISKTGIKKSHLSQCIKTAKDNPDDRQAWKKWKDEKGRSFGFVEKQ